ncbi:MAG: tRNA (N6-isopentenyl adenosine(37)-C2)-methylthiotransferase MiaB [candidate division Zixibacteria bacterium]|nr:tRNA (N6-isopentenyl adenosine(37)-C2)-methylthiotransferase MiaB [candidate division Zixibacteria bacterium]
MAKKFYILTFGCQMNEYDSEVLESILASDGYIMTDKPEDADLAVINTCSVRQKAESRAMARIGQIAALKKDMPALKVIVAGCMAKRAGQAIIDDLPGVDYVVGPDYIPEIPDIIASTDSERVYIDEKAEATGLARGINPGRVTGFLAITKGCENYCSYCIVPYVRGSMRSRPSKSIIAELKILQDMGAKDITLLGQNVNSYRDDSLDFPSLLQRIAPDSPSRLRFLTSHPKDMSDELIACFAELPSLCQSLHLPLQAGSDKILEVMNRGYTSGHYLGLINKLRQAAPNISLTTDLIVGFPGETDDDFEQTLKLVKEIKYDSAFMFRYSVRPGTKAAELDDDVPEAEKIDRLNRLIAVQQEISSEQNTRWIGRSLEVLIEKRSRREPFWPQGKTRGGQSVLIKNNDQLNAGDLIMVEIESSKAKTLFGLFEKFA